MLKDRTNNQLAAQMQVQVPSAGKQQLLINRKSTHGASKQLVTTEVACHESSLHQKTHTSRPWSVSASCGSTDTINPIREIIETMNLAENPDKKVIPLSIGDPTIFGNLKPCEEIVEALSKAVTSGKYFGYQTASGMELARDAVASYHNKFTGNNVKRQVSIDLQCLSVRLGLFFFVIVFSFFSSCFAL